jgi:hypothetical protein
MPYHTISLATYRTDIDSGADNVPINTPYWVIDRKLPQTLHMGLHIVSTVHLGAFAKDGP